MQQPHPATTLTAGQRAALIDQARQVLSATGGHGDPARLQRIRTWWRSEVLQWAQAVTCRSISTMRQLSEFDLVLLDLAHEVEPSPPRSAPHHRAERQSAAENERRRRADEQASARWQEWTDLRTALPVPVQVAHNYTSARHLDGYTQGADHIILQAALHAGQLHRAEGQPLCWTPSRRRALRVFDDPGDHRYPTCQRCVRTAYRLTGRTLSPLLVRNS